jgi:hypothetical protein
MTFEMVAKGADLQFLVIIVIGGHPGGSMQ